MHSQKTFLFYNPVPSTLCIFVKKNEQHEEDFSHHFVSNFSVKSAWENPPKLVYGSCYYRTNAKFNLDRHSEKCKTLDPSPINHSCNLCNKTFSPKKNLTRHKKLHDRTNNAKPICDVSCVVCKKTFVNTWNMSRHTNKDHGLTEIDNVVENSVGIAVFTTEALHYRLRCPLGRIF